MFNVLISGNGTDWESDQRMEMSSERFLEHSGDESESISLNNPSSLKILERIPSLLLYEEGAGGDDAHIVRLGEMRSIRVVGGRITFRFAETGRVDRSHFLKLRIRLQISDWEMHRTHWAVKDGDIPQ